MFKYKDKLAFRFERDSNGKIFNREDNYIACLKKGKIWRYNDKILVFESPVRIQVIRKDSEGDIVKDYTPYIIRIEDSDQERLIYFEEKHFKMLKSLFKVRKKRKNNELTEEQKRELTERLAKTRAKRGGIETEDIEEEMEEILDEIENID